ncbi:hypothetical protein V8B97DRAFT_1866131 [Scleroderma yunnanense]
MVKLSLISPKGNQGIRYFPHQGYLGLTPVRVEGLVRTHIEQDGKPLLARDITVAVRCYEARHGRFGAVHMNVLSEHTTTIWQKDSCQDWSELGDSEHQFRISIPSNDSAPSTALYFQEYRVFWRVEAVLSHFPITGVGSRQSKYFELPLIRYGSPTHSLPTPPSSAHLTSLTTTKARGPPLHYRLLVPPCPIGPLDIITIQLMVQPLDASVSIRSASALVERRIHLYEASPVTPSSPDPTVVSTLANGILEFSSSTLNASIGSSRQELHAPSSVSLYSDSSFRPINHSPTQDDIVSYPSHDRAITHIFAHSQSSASFTRDPSGVWRQNFTFSWPDTKSHSRWSVGESMQTEMATVKFFLRVKLVVSSSMNNAESIDLEDKELTIVSTNDSQRQIALARYSESVHPYSGRPKSKSPRRSKHELATEQPPTPPRSPDLSTPNGVPATVPVDKATHKSSDSRLSHTYKFSCASEPHSQTNPKAKRTRRPHTSAGPRDKPNAFGVRGYEPLPGTSQLFPVSVGPETTAPSEASRTKRQIWPEVPRLGLGCSSNPVGHNGSGTTSHPVQGGHAAEQMQQGDIHASEELARIESASRKSSAGMFGFITQRKKSTGLLPALRTFLPAG